MIPEDKGLHPRELAHKWMKDLGIRPYRKDGLE